MRDTSFWLRGEASIDEFMADPIVHLVMRSDPVSEGELRTLLRITKWTGVRYLRNSS